MRTIFISLILSLSIYSHINACTVIAIGKKASVDGSVIVSHTDAGPDCRLNLVPSQTHQAGDKASVYWGMIESGRPLGDYGEVIGQIPQVEQTYAYFQTAYPQINSKQLAIGESTLSQRAELMLDRSVCEQIMTIEQAQAFALQRCTTAEDALQLITQLLETYGFLPSCVDESESLVIADTEEIWVLEVFSVGNEWKKESGKPGCIWAAQRVPDDHAMIIPNWSIIKQIDIEDKDNYRASSNYKQEAIDRGWYNPDSGLPFIWQEAYSPFPREWSTSRFWLFYATYAPNFKEWPDRFTESVWEGENQYTQYVEPLSSYPFSVKPEKKMSVQDVMAFQRSTFTGTVYDKENASTWYYPNEDGEMIKSAFATPFPTIEMRRVMNINSRRNVARARGEYGMVAQLRGWLPDEVGGVYWFYVDNAYTSAYVPIYTGVSDVAECYKVYNPAYYQDNSIRWAVDFVDNLMYLRWQDASELLRSKREPMEARFFAEQADVDEKAQALLKKNPKKAKAYLTQLTIDRMNEVHQLFKDLKLDIISEYTNNKQGI
ncbi:dipeptidase [Carboxylicivirga sp. M1479]|uniref:dipeptidase n=1 Tax=Carboxylicivirga sp. M1479 TaxID=2594476 RepID=UPI00117892D7|nr:C69 family dipeptidase [Carboxylicivirga sp. M1479]TRX62002.1 peptidase [Carboxylicivirga sp. M1479]